MRVIIQLSKLLCQFRETHTHLWMSVRQPGCLHDRKCARLWKLPTDDLLQIPRLRMCGTVCRCMHRESSYNICTNQLEAQNFVIRLYFPLDALHVSDCISPSSEATFISCTSHLVYADTSGCCVAITTKQPGVSAYTGIYQMRCTANKVAPDDGLI